MRVPVQASGCGFEPMLLKVAAALPRLVHLHIGEATSVAADDAGVKAAAPAALALLGNCHALATLNVSNLHISVAQVIATLYRVSYTKQQRDRNCDQISFSRRRAEIIGAHVSPGWLLEVQVT